MTQCLNYQWHSVLSEIHMRISLYSIAGLADVLLCISNQLVVPQGHYSTTELPKHSA